MTHRRVGSSGLKVSTIGLGSWLTYGTGVDEETSTRCIRAALEVGILFFDTADVYGAGAAERLLGKALSGCERSDLVIATKAYFPISENPNARGLSRKHLFESIEKSLKRLQTEYVDLYQCHRFDAQAPVDETVRAMGDLIRQGKTLYWGVSLWDETQIEEAIRLSDAMGSPRPISNQPPYNMLQRDIELRVLPFCERVGIGQVVFSPLAEGLLTGKYAGGEIPESSRAASERFGKFLRPRMTKRNHAIVARLVDLAGEAGLTLPAMALAWALRLQGVSSVIVGASRPEQVRENARAGSISLDDDLVRAIEMVLSGS
jgi:voltage-dependent potassium channel beta subunit